MMKGVYMEITKEILFHWWHHCGKRAYTFAEFEEFRNIIQKYGEDRVFDAVIASLICDDGSPTPLLLGIRQNKVEEFFKSLPTSSNFTDEQNAQLAKLRESVLQILYDSYNK